MDLKISNFLHISDTDIRLVFLMLLLSVDIFELLDGIKNENTQIITSARIISVQTNG